MSSLTGPTGAQGPGLFTLISNDSNINFINKIGRAHV